MKKFKYRVFMIFKPYSNKDIISMMFDWFIILLIILNIAFIILDTFSGLPDWYAPVSHNIEIITVIIFTIEYILRLWTSNYIFENTAPIKARIKYVFSFMALADLFAILPFYLPFLIPIDLRVLRMIRLFRLLRLFKVNRYTKALSTVGNVLKRKSNQLLSSMFVVLILMVMSSILMYAIENVAQPEVFENAFSGLWWAFATLTTVGYGDIYPITVAGKVLGTIIALLGIGLVAVPTGIISAGFIENINDDEKEESIKSLNCKMENIIKSLEELKLRIEPPTGRN